MRGFSCYLRTPDARTVGAWLGTGTGAKVGLLGRGAAGPVLFHVGTAFVVPTGAVYEPTEGAVTVPYPPSPGDCASAKVLVRVKAVASTRVLSFMRGGFLVVFTRDNRRTIAPSLRSFHELFLSAMKPATLFTSR
jgi:membrane carboxypeptidase/penicillin-binding protein PbpC